MREEKDEKKADTRTPASRAVPRKLQEVYYTVGGRAGSGTHPRESVHWLKTIIELGRRTSSGFTFPRCVASAKQPSASHIVPLPARWHLHLGLSWSVYPGPRSSCARTWSSRSMRSSRWPHAPTPLKSSLIPISISLTTGPERESHSDQTRR